MENNNLGYVPNLSERLQKLNTSSRQAGQGFTWAANYTYATTVHCQKQAGELWFEIQVRMSPHLYLSQEYGPMLVYSYFGVAIDNPATAFTILPYAPVTMGGYDYVILSTDFTIQCLAEGQPLDTYYNFTLLYLPEGETMTPYANTYEPIEI